MQQLAQIQNTSVNIAGSKCLGNSAKCQFLQVSPRKIDNLISGRGANKSGGAAKFFERNKRGRCLFVT